MKLIFGAPVFFLVIFFSSNSYAGIEFDDVNYDWDSGRCSHSSDGSDVSCGGQSGRTATSRDRSKKSRAGWYSHLEEF